MKVLLCDTYFSGLKVISGLVLEVPFGTYTRTRSSCPQCKMPWRGVETQSPASASEFGLTAHSCGARQVRSIPVSQKQEEIPYVQQITLAALRFSYSHLSSLVWSPALCIVAGKVVLAMVGVSRYPCWSCSFYIKYFNVPWNHRKKNVSLFWEKSVQHGTEISLELFYMDLKNRTKQNKISISCERILREINIPQHKVRVHLVNM